MSVQKTEETADDGKKGGIQVIARSAAVMRALGASPHGLSLAAIAHETGLARSTVQRIVNALETEHLVEAIGPSGGFRIGPALSQLIYFAQADIISEVRPHLERLCTQFDETTALISRAGDMVNVVDRVISEQVLRLVIPIGSRAPLYASAPGKVILASMPQSEADAILKGPLRKSTEKTLSLPDIKAQIAQARTDGFATDVDEHDLGAASVAVPLTTFLGNFAIAIIVPTSRFEDRLEEFKAALQAARKEIEARIGAGTRRRKESGA